MRQLASIDRGLKQQLEEGKNETSTSACRGAASGAARPHNSMQPYYVHSMAAHCPPPLPKLTWPGLPTHLQRCAAGFMLSMAPDVDTPRCSHCGLQVPHLRACSACRGASYCSRGCQGEPAQCLVSRCRMAGWQHGQQLCQVQEEQGLNSALGPARPCRSRPLARTRRAQIHLRAAGGGAAGPGQQRRQLRSACQLTECAWRTRSFYQSLTNHLCGSLKSS